MSKGAFRVYLDTYSLPAAGTKTVTLDMSLVRSNATCKLLVIADWLNGTDAGTTGLEITRLPGTGPDPDADSVDNEYATDDPNTVDKPQVANPATGLSSAAAGTNKYVTPFS